MPLNAQAVEQNAAIEAACPAVLSMLSRTGQAIYFPARGILSQSADAATKATRYNATIGTATEGGKAMHLACIHKAFAADVTPNEVYPYPPSTGLPDLRAAWQAKLVADTPSLSGQAISQPLVTNALTHGLSLCGQLFLDRGDTVLVSDLHWENYDLMWDTVQGAKVKTFPLFTKDLAGFGVEGLKAALAKVAGKKVMIVLNFPNNPTGYTITEAEGAAIVAALTAAAAGGTRIIAVCDDAYYGMFYHPDCQSESLFGALAKAHANLLAVRLDGPTKEMFAWALRVGFITYGVANGTPAVYKALEQKTAGLIRSAVSNITRPGQAIALRALKDADFRRQQAEKVAILRDRADEVRRVVYDKAYKGCWDVYPFNSGYFMCLRLKGVAAEAVRQRLLTEHQTGAIALGKRDLRVAFSCLEKGQIADVFARIAQAVQAEKAAAKAVG